MRAMHLKSEHGTQQTTNNSSALFHISAFGKSIILKHVRRIDEFKQQRLKVHKVQVFSNSHSNFEPHETITRNSNSKNIGTKNVIAKYMQTKCQGNQHGDPKTVPNLTNTKKMEVRKMVGQYPTQPCKHLASGKDQNHPNH